MRRNGLLLLATTLGLISLLANPAHAGTYFFDLNGTTAGLGTLVSGSTFDWDDVSTGGLWNSTSTGSGSNYGWAVPASTGTGTTTTTLQGNFPKFTNSVAGQTFTVTVSNDEQTTGLWMSTAGTLIIQQHDPGTAGEDLNFLAGTDGIIGATGAVMKIYAPITGVGTLNANTGGTVDLYGANTYSGGTSLSTSATLIGFNNSSSFGGQAAYTITDNDATATAFIGLLSSGGSAITLPNNFAMGTAAASGTGINFGSGANTPVILSGTMTLGAAAAKYLDLRNNGDGTAPLTITGAIGGLGGFVLSGQNSGSITFSSTQNTYAGTTTVGIAGAQSKITLILGAANAIASSSGIIMSGGTLNPDALNQIMGSTTLGLTAASTFDFGAGTSEMDFANSSGVSWTTTTLNLANYTAYDAMRFGTDSTGLTSAQLSDIEFNGLSGLAMLDPNGYLINSSTPEPASWALMGMGSVLFTTITAAGRRRGRRISRRV